MNPREVEFLRRLIDDAPQRRAAGPSAQHLAESEGIGKLRGNSVEYTASDHERARNMLTSRGYDIASPQGPFRRSEAPSGGSEKTKALRVTQDMVAVVTLNLPALPIPSGGFLAMPMADALALPYEVLLVCENMEPLLRLQNYQWLSHYVRGRSTLALFRGAPGFFRTDVAARFIAADTRPTLAFFDFDPKGLSLAASLPRRQALCLPSMEVLKLAVFANRRTHLFTNSVDGSRTQLDALPEGEICEAWRLMKAWTMGLDQEHFPQSTPKQ